MKTDAKISMTALAAFFGVLVTVTPCAFAQTGNVKVDFSASPASSAPSTPSVTVAAAPSVAAKDAIEISGIKEKEKAVEEDEEDTTVPKGLPKSVKGVVKKLNTATKDVTIEDLNAAREAIVKLDVLIDIEKRLNDLTTLRQEREEKTGGAMGDGSVGISVSGKAGGYGAAVPPPSLVPVAQQQTPMAANAPMMPEKDIEVKKVVGVSGRYMATITDIDGSSRQVRAGDKLANGSVIDSISRSGVTVLSQSKKRNTIQVKDIGTIFGS